MRQIILDGRIGKDGATVGETKNGKKYVRFSLANDTFENGERKTDWFDVTSYDPYVIEKRTEYLTKGTYVIITGSLTSKVSVKTNNIWLNHYITATSIETPSPKRNDENGAAPANGATPSPIDTTVSTYTATTESAKEVAASPVETAQSPSPAPFAASAASSDDDDMPF